MLKYHEVYRVETDEPVLRYLALTGSAPFQDGRWIFWRWRHDRYEDPTTTLRILEQKDLGSGVVGVTVQMGSEEQPIRVGTKFIPVTVEYMLDNPAVYGITPDFITMLKTPGMREAYFSMDVSEEYNQEFEPAEDDLAERYADDQASPQALKVENGGFFEKQVDGSWKKLDWFP